MFAMFNAHTVREWAWQLTDDPSCTFVGMHALLDCVRVHICVELLSVPRVSPVPFHYKKQD